MKCFYRQRANGLFWFGVIVALAVLALLGDFTQAKAGWGGGSCSRSAAMFSGYGFAPQYNSYGVLPYTGYSGGGCNPQTCPQGGQCCGQCGVGGCACASCAAPAATYTWVDCGKFQAYNRNGKTVGVWDGSTFYPSKGDSFAYDGKKALVLNPTDQTIAVANK